MRKRSNRCAEAGRREAHRHEERGPWRALGAKRIQQRRRSQRATLTARSTQRARLFGDAAVT
eukprot:7776864-Alexandrium_andersonii.AAC.1